VANKEYVADYFEAEIEGVVSSISFDRNKQIMAISNPTSGVVIKKYEFTPKQTITVGEGDLIQVSQKIAEGTFYNRVLYSDLSRLWLTALFIFVAWQVRRATNLRRKTGRIDQ
jgi:hypothetical protein